MHAVHVQARKAFHAQVSCLVAKAVTDAVKRAGRTCRAFDIEWCRDLDLTISSGMVYLGGLIRRKIKHVAHCCLCLMHMKLLARYTEVGPCHHPMCATWWTMYASACLLLTQDLYSLCMVI